MKEPHFIPFGVGEMPNETITDVVEGADGYIWVSSEAGIVRFGGSEFEPISPPPNEAGNRTNTAYLDLSPAPDGQLWITNFNSFEIYDSRTELFLQTIEFETDLIEDSFADILFFSEAGVWLVFRNETQTVLALANRNGVLQQQWPLRDASNADHSYSFAGVDEHNNLWFWVEEEQHLLRFNTDEFLSSPSELTLPNAKELENDSSPQVDWLGVLESKLIVAQLGDSLTVVDPETIAISNQAVSVSDSKLSGAYIRDSAVTPDGRIWLATNSSGLFEISPSFDSFKQHTPNDNSLNGLPGYTVTSLLVDRFGMLWLGTFNGVFLVDPNRNAVATFSRANRLLENSDAIEILVQDSEKLWVGHANGVDAINLETGARRIYSPENEDNFSPSEVSALAQTSDGKIYLGSQFSESLYVLDTTRDSFVISKEYENAGLYGGIISLNSLGENNLLISKAGELVSFQNGEVSVLEGAGPTNSSGVVRLSEEEFLIAQLNLGLFVYNLRAGTYENVTPPRLEGSVVFDADSIDLGIVWVITESGAFELAYNDASFSVLSHVPASRLPSNQYASILVDQRRDVWVGSQGGAFRISRNANSIEEAFSVDYYGADQGFPQSTYFVAVASRVGDEFVALGSTGGAIVFNPAWFVSSEKPPEIYLRNFLRFNKRVEVGENFDDRVILNEAMYRSSRLELDYTDSVIGFQFSAMHTRTPRTNKLWYQLEGIDPDWNESPINGLATYSSLPPGNYQFKIRAQSGDSVHVEQPYVVDLRMNPVWWQSWEFRLAAALALFFTVFAAFNWRTRIMRDRAESLELMVKEATAGLAVKNEQLEIAREKAEAAMEARSQFLANMSHEIRTPINGVIGMTSLLEKSSLSREQRSYLGTVKTSGEALLGIINEILDFSKIEAGELVVEKKQFSLEKCISDAVSTLSPVAEKKKIQLVVYFKVDHRTLLVADEQRIGQALRNLLSNAVKFTQEGEVVVDVSWTSSEYDGGDTQDRVLNISVIDSGIGIARESLDGLFDPFTQADASTTRKFGGTGLGLSITKKTVEAMGGELRAESTINVGSTFSIVLPVALAAEKENQEKELDDKKISVFSRNKFEQRALLFTLERAGALVSVFTGVDELKDHMIRFPKRLLLIDGEGNEEYKSTVQSFLKNSPASTPVVYITTLEDFENASNTYPVVLGKPVLPSEVLNAIKASESAQSIPQEIEQENYTDPEFGGLNVLIAEDNQVNQMVAKKIISTLGISADLAKNGVEALEKLAESDYDIVFMDIQMPEMDGIEATKRIRQNQTGSPYIIAMTANVYAEDRERCLTAGMNDFVPKPVRIDDVREAMLKAQSAIAS